MKKSTIALLNGISKQYVNKLTIKRVPNERKKSNIRKKNKLFNGSNGRGVVQPLLCEEPAINDKAMQQSA